MEIKSSDWPFKSLHSRQDSKKYQLVYNRHWQTRRNSQLFRADVMYKQVVKTILEHAGECQLCLLDVQEEICDSGFQDWVRAGDKM